MHKADNLLCIPLEEHMYRLTGIGDQTREQPWHVRRDAEKNGHKLRPLIFDDRNIVGYELTEATRRIVDAPAPAKLNPVYTLDYVRGVGVCLLVPDHSFGRGLMSLLFGWKYIASCPRWEVADKMEAHLRKNAEGPWLRSRLYGSSAWMDAFSLREESDLHLCQLSFCQVEAKLSKEGRLSVMDASVPIEFTA